jgi:hypothetical protein
VPIEDLVHVGVAVVADQEGLAHSCRWTVYVGSVDVTTDQLDLHERSVDVGQAVKEAHREAITYLEVMAASKITPPDATPPSPPSTASTAPLRRRPRGASVRIDPSPADRVEGVVDPPGRDRRDDPVGRRVDAPVRPGLKSAGQVRPRRRKAVD